MGKLGITGEKIAARLARVVVLALLLLGAPLAAQSTTTVSNTTTGTVNTTNCTTSFSRTFAVTANVQVTEVELGIRATGTYRGNMRVTLQSPAGTTVQLVNGVNPPTGITGNNLAVRFDDDAAQVVNTDSATGNHTNTGPPYPNTFKPNNPLSAFDGETSTGTWTLRMCEISTSATYGDISFVRADLYVTGVATDLSLTNTVSNATPAFGANITYTLTVTNAAASNASATGVTVMDLLPAGVTYTGFSGFGSYDPVTGIWTVGTLTAGQSRSLTINVTVAATAGATITNTAEVWTSNEYDIDSVPGDSAVDDDLVARNFTVSGSRTAGTAPTLICPKSTIVFDWDTRAWTTSATSANFAVTGIGTVAFAITNPGAWLNLYGGTNPVRQNTITGGFTPAQFSLAETVNLASQSQVTTTTITLPIAVDGAQFRIFDVDFASGQFADRVRVTGSFDGTPVTPVLTNGVSNYVIGNQAYGDTTSTDASANGNVVVTFQSAVDTIVIEYGNHSTAPTDPGQQAITIHDITFCEPFADISVTKVSSLLSDPIRGSTNPLMIPGATLSYCVLVTNSGNAWAGSVVANDTLPATMTYVAGTMRSGSSCASATTVEDDNATGTDETDPLGASVTGSLLKFTATTLDHDEAIAFTFSTTVN